MILYMCKSVCLSACVKRFHVYLLFDPCCDPRRSSVIVCNEPSRLGVDLFLPINVSACVRIPHRGAVFQCWSHKCVISYVVNVRCVAM